MSRARGRRARDEQRRERGISAERSLAPARPAAWVGNRRSRGFGGRSRANKLPVACGAYAARLCGGRVIRCDRPSHMSTAVRKTGRAVYIRQSARRGQQYRHRDRRPGSTRRLFAVVVYLRERNQRDALSEPKFQFRQRFCAGRRHVQRAERAGGASVRSGPHRSRIHCLCQGPSGTAQLRLRRHRRHPAYVGRIVQVHDRHRHASCAL